MPEKSLSSIATGCIFNSTKRREGFFYQGLRSTPHKLKKIGILGVLFSTFFLTGCFSQDVAQVQVQNFILSIPTAYQSISPQSLDGSQIANTILAAWKKDGGNLILAESTLPSTVSLQEFIEKTQTRLSQEFIGYKETRIKKKSFTCNGEKLAGYITSFEKATLEDPQKVETYYQQYYFAQSGSIYVFSLAQKEAVDSLDTIIDSLQCKTSF